MRFSSASTPSKAGATCSATCWCGITGILNPTQFANTPLAQLTQILNALLALSRRTA
jgi:hypothetical protein